MKTTKTYLSGCKWCNGNGYVQPVQGQITSTSWSNVCPVCNGSKVITVTEYINNKQFCICTEEDKIKYEITIDDGKCSYCGWPIMY